MSAIESLEQRMEALSRRIETLEPYSRHASFRRRPILAICAAFVLGALLVGPLFRESRARATMQPSTDPREILCTSLKIVDEKGQALLVLGTDEDGGLMKILARDGGQRMFVGVGSKMSGGIIGLQDKAGKYRTVWDVNDAGTPGLSMRNAAGKIEAFLGASTKGRGGLFNVNDPEGRSRIILDLNDNWHGGVGFYSADRKTEAFLGASNNGWGGVFNLNGSDGIQRIIMDVGEKGDGRLGFFNRDKNRELFLGSEENGQGGLIVVNDPTGQNRLFLEVTRDGNGYIQLRDRSGTVRNELR